MRHIGVLLPVVFAFLVGAAPASAWTWPVEGPVMQPFSFGGDPYAGGQHRGIDVGAASNAPVRAPAAGLVSFAGSVPRGGLTVTIRTDDGYAVTLVHLGTAAVGKGQQVLEGDVVGAVGPSGEAEQRSPYVHLGVRVAADEHGYVDPLTLLPARPGGVERAGGRGPGGRGCGRRGRRRTPARAALLGSRARASIGGGPDRGVQRGRRHRRIAGAERASRRDRLRVERGRCRRRPGADGAGGLRRDRRVGPGRGRGTPDAGGIGEGLAGLRRWRGRRRCRGRSSGCRSGAGPCRAVRRPRGAPCRKPRKRVPGGLPAPADAS